MCVRMKGKVMVKRGLLHVKALLAAAQFLTLIPIPVKLDWTVELQKRALLYYPVVGLLLGLILVSVTYMASWIFSYTTPLFSAAIVLSVWVLLTGALHLDGLADSADGWMGGLGDREKTLQIMKDPCVGVTGAVTLIVVCLLKFTALVGLMEYGSVPLIGTALLITPVLARAAAMCLLVTTPYVREGGIASSWIGQINVSDLFWPLMAVAGVAIWLAPVALLIALAVLWACRRVMLVRLQGATGDTAGATIELIELAILMGMNAYIS